MRCIARREGCGTRDHPRCGMSHGGADVGGSSPRNLVRCIARREGCGTRDYPRCGMSHENSDWVQPLVKERVCLARRTGRCTRHCPQRRRLPRRRSCRVRQLHTEHGQSVERGLAEYLLVVVAQRSPRQRVVIALLGPQQRPPHGLRPGPNIAQLRDEVQHQSLGVGNQVRVPIAIAGVSDEGCPTAQKRLRPVNARHNARRRVVRHVEARVTADREDQAALVVRRRIGEDLGGHDIARVVRE